MSTLIVLLGLSIIAGFVGTVAMTVSQEIELRFITKRPLSFTPVLALFKILRLDFEKLTLRMKVLASYAVHFVYGTVWGFPLALLYFFGFTDPVAVGVTYFFIALFQGWIVLWVINVAGPPWTWGRQAVLSELIHKTVYAVFGTVFFMLLLL